MRRWRLALVIGIPVALILIVGTVYLLPRFTTPRTQNAQVTPTVATTHLTNADATRLENALNSSDMKVQATVMAPELASAYLAQGKPAYPNGSIVKVLPDRSVCQNSACEVTAIVTQPGGKQTTFLLYLSNDFGKWLIVGTNKES